MSGIILHEISNIATGLMECPDPAVQLTFRRLVESIQGLKLIFDQKDDIVYERVKPRDLLTRVTSSFDSKIRIMTDRARSPVLACPTLITLILHNLVRNGFKYAGPDGRVIIRAIATRRCLMFAVHNIGIPMEPALTRSMFNRQAEKAHGMGLGLYICQKSAARMGGSIKARSHRSGTCFIVKVPLFGESDRH